MNIIEEKITLNSRNFLLTYFIFDYKEQRKKELFNNLLSLVCLYVKNLSLYIYI